MFVSIGKFYPNVLNIWFKVNYMFRNFILETVFNVNTDSTNSSTLSADEFVVINFNLMFFNQVLDKVMLSKQ